MSRFSSRPELPSRARMAGQLHGPKAGLVKKLIQPWKDTEASDVPHLSPSAMQLGKSESEYLEDAHQLKLDIQRRSRGDKEDRIDLIKDLQKYHGFTATEATKTMQDIQENPYRELRQVRYGVPNAQADEQVSRVALLMDGWDNVEFNNNGQVESTDLRGTINGFDYDIDAQARMTRDGRLNLSMLDHVSPDQAQRVMNEIFDARNVYEGINRVIGNGRYGVSEGKLLDTIDYNNLRHTDFFDRNRNERNKDLLVTTNRRNQFNRSSQYERDGHLIGFPARHSPYERTLPSYIDTIDLNALRDDVFSRKGDAQLGNMIIKPQGNSIKLEIPTEDLNRYQFGGHDMSDDVFKGLIAAERQSRR